MDKPTKEFTDLLLSKGIISLEQLNEAAKLARSDNSNVGDALVNLGYASLGRRLEGDGQVPQDRVHRPSLGAHPEE